MESEKANSRRSIFTRMASAYGTLALISFNTLLLFGAMNLAAWLISRPGGARAALPEAPPVVATYGIDTIRQAYPHRDDVAIKRLLNETWGRELSYEPFTEFREGPCKGEYVNVSLYGFRLGKDQAPWPPVPEDLVVFMFGGSTTFGYGVADEETIPSRLQEILRASGSGRRVSVYNFGRGYYYSSLERILLERLLLAGYHPQVAVFLDGFNEFSQLTNESRLSRGIAHALDSLGRSGREAWWNGLPIMAWKEKTMDVQARLAEAHRNTEILLGFDSTSRHVDEAQANRLCSRYLTNREIIRGIVGRFGINTLFVWQPVRGVKVNGEGRITGLGEVAAHPFVVTGYACMEKLSPPAALADFLQLNGLEAKKSVPAYVDGVHYSESYSRDMAQAIATALNERGFIWQPSGSAK